jgi:hypothetical protein
MAEEKTEFKVSGEDLLKKIKQIIHEGNARRIYIKDENGHVFIEIPLTVGIVGVALAPILAAVGAIAALVSSFTIEVVKKEEDKKEEVKKD